MGVLTRLVPCKNRLLISKAVGAISERSLEWFYQIYTHVKVSCSHLFSSTRLHNFLSTLFTILFSFLSCWEKSHKLATCLMKCRAVYQTVVERIHNFIISFKDATKKKHWFPFIIPNLATMCAGFLSLQWVEFHHIWLVFSICSNPISRLFLGGVKLESVEILIKQSSLVI